MENQTTKIQNLERKTKLSLVLGIISSASVILIASFAEIIARYSSGAAIGFYPLSPLVSSVFLLCLLLEL